MNGQAECPDEEPLDEVEATDLEAPADPELEIEEPEGEAEISELDTLKAAVEENLNKYLRAAAELENVRKRSTRDVESAHRFALERFSKQLLAVRDSFEMGLASSDNASVESLLEGSAATLKLLGSTMQQFGIEVIEPEGEPFDPEFHEAISMRPSDDSEPGSVLTVAQKGYTLNGRLLRPAMVVVAAE